MAFQNLITRITIPIVALLLLSGCGRVVKEEIEIGWKGIAKIDRFLAAARFIEAMGTPSGSYPSAPQMPPKKDTMLFLPASTMKSQGLLEQMDNWIYDGGNVVFLLQVEDEGEYWINSNDSPIQEFLEYEGIELRADLESNGVEEGVSSIYFGDSKQFKEEYQTEYPNSFEFRFPPEKQGDDEDFYLYDSYEYGEGSVSILSTGLLFTNKYLDKAEHATLLWDLVKWHQPSEVQFIFSTNQPFWTLLWEHASHAIIALILLLFFWIWASVKRFGPVFQTIDPSLNKLDEHLTATGNFFSKHKADTLIVEQVKKELCTALARKANLPLNADLPHVLRECKNQNHLNADQIAFIEAPYPEKAKEQLAYIQTLKKLQS